MNFYPTTYTRKRLDELEWTYLIHSRARNGVLGGMDGWELKLKRDANKRFIKNIPNTLLLLTKTLFQKHKNIFDPLWIGRVKSTDPTAS